MRVARKYLRIRNTDQKRGTDMQAPAQHEALNVGAIATVDEVLQKVAEHKGCGTSGGSGKASCGSAAGQGDLPTARPGVERAGVNDEVGAVFHGQFPEHELPGQWTADKPLSIR